jgi:hypothetical protein
MAAEDAGHGWRQGGAAELHDQRRRIRAAAAGSIGSTSNSAGRRLAGSRKHKVLVAVPTANVWAKTQLLLHSLAATSDDFQLMVNTATGSPFVPLIVSKFVSDA